MSVAQSRRESDLMALYVCIRCNREFPWDKEGRPELCDTCLFEVRAELQSKLHQALLGIFKVRTEMIETWTKAGEVPRSQIQKMIDNGEV